ncbi:thiamine pyrophosphate-dependent acetolactate synthase large subunit-like protein [Streptomyces demainii]|uniref:Thiamine pyrophosphate-dependent acetolactate synthase large subunit-like protein n=1 Tax=Streptomyces demainii TaxID=588122 RepID=A0ABT9KY37_9ACTN|nr:thiamine pyrophosphate-dependent acetolactate synthase large subunit-like protein [Streptomyces demainii]
MASVCAFIAARLRAWDVDRVFGVPGRHIDPLVTALPGERTPPEFIHARHEESATLMACAHAKLTGRAGCCLASPGSGALHLLGGLYDAALDRPPVVAVVGREPPSPVSTAGRRCPSPGAPPCRQPLPSR